jgi:hypothetical protein
MIDKLYKKTENKQKKATKIMNSVLETLLVNKEDEKIIDLTCKAEAWYLLGLQIFEDLNRYTAPVALRMALKAFRKAIKTSKKTIKAQKHE